MQNTKIPNDELIAIALGDADASPQAQGWLNTDEGRHEMNSYHQVLNMLDTLYGDVSAQTTRRVVYYAPVRTPVGRLLVAAAERGLVRIGFDRSQASFVAGLREQLKAEVIESEEKVADVAAQLKAYFAGERRAFDVPIDLSFASAFQRRVLMAARSVPAGQVVTYGELARRIGTPSASRAVGQALGRNPVPIVIPCHRIVRSDGGLGGYIGGLQVKRKLLQIEGVTAAR